MKRLVVLVISAFFLVVQHISLSAPYDLSGHDIHYEIRWPSEPELSEIVHVSTSAELREAVRRSKADVRITDGLYRTDLIVSGGDLRLFGTSAVTIDGQVQIGAQDKRVQRLKLQGFRITTGPLKLDNADDILIENVHAATERNLNNFTGGGGTGQGTRRLAVVNSTLEVDSGRGGGDWAIFTSLAPNEDWIFANVKLISNGGQNNRLQNITRLTIVDSIFNPGGQSVNSLRTLDITDAYFGDLIVGKGGWLTGSKRNPLSITNGKIVRMIKYGNSHVFLNQSDQSGVFNDGILRSRRGAPGTEAGIGGFSGSNNVIEAWDGSTYPDSSHYGADH